MPRRYSLLAAAVIVAFQSGVSGQGDSKIVRSDDGEMKLESLLKAADSALEREISKIRERLKSAVLLFSTPVVDSGRVYRQEREVLIGFGPMSLPELISAFRSTDNRDALEQLGQVIVAVASNDRPAATVVALSKMMKAENVERARAATLVLGMIRATDVAADVRHVAQKAANDQVKAAAYLAMAWLEDPEAPPIWQAALAGTSPILRRGALQAIERTGRVQEFKLVYDCLTASEMEVVMAAIGCLGSFKDHSDTLKILHDIARQTDSTRERSKREALAALDSIGRIGNKEASRRYLKDIVTATDGDNEIRYRAARVLMDMGIDDGLEKLVDERRKTKGKDEPSIRLEVGKIYFDFKRYKQAALELEKALPRFTNPSDVIDICDKLARSHARLGNFQKASEYLQKATGGFEWKNLKNDEDFSEMLKDRRWSKNFE